MFLLQLLSIVAVVVAYLLAYALGLIPAIILFDLPDRLESRLD